MAWHRNFIENWRYIQDAYDQRFQRMWVYYLLSCAGSFRARRNQLWQVVFSKNGGSGNPCQSLNHIAPIHCIR
jgi:cyclopropane-fatty-acyl-phospholipid synthase